MALDFRQKRAFSPHFDLYEISSSGGAGEDAYKVAGAELAEIRKRNEAPPAPHANLDSAAAARSPVKGAAGATGT